MPILARRQILPQLKTPRKKRLEKHCQQIFTRSTDLFDTIWKFVAPCLYLLVVIRGMIVRETMLRFCGAYLASLAIISLLSRKNFSISQPSNIDLSW